MAKIIPSMILAEFTVLIPDFNLYSRMQYISTVLSNFPELIETKLNLSNLIYLGSSMFNTRFMVRREFFSFFASLLEAEKFLRGKRAISGMSGVWCTVWDLTIK